MRKSKNIRLGLDLDGCLYNFESAIRDHIAESTGRPAHEMVPATCWNFFSDQWGYSLEEYKNHVIDGITANKVFREGTPIDNCVEVVRRLYEKFEIIFITARSGFGQTVEICRKSTIDWLHDHDIPFDGLILSEDKTNRGFDLLLDDAPYQVENACNAGDKAVIFDRPWNQMVGHVDRVFSWDHFEHYLSEKFASA